jgi:hypothetical protein
MSGLYAWTRIDTPSPNNIYTVDHGQLVVFPITVEAGQKREITVTHVAVGIQDHSLRVWMSRDFDVGGQTLGETLPTRFWHPNRTPTEKVTVYDRNEEAPAGFTIALDPGTYLLNVLNLVNSRNAFAFVLTDLV